MPAETARVVRCPPRELSLVATGNVATSQLRWTTGHSPLVLSHVFSGLIEEIDGFPTVCLAHEMPNSNNGSRPEFLISGKTS